MMARQNSAVAHGPIVTREGHLSLISDIVKKASDKVSLH